MVHDSQGARFVRRTFQGAYVFNAWLHCPVVGDYLHEVQVFADNKREAKEMAIHAMSETTLDNKDA